jgi:hypothetical protein
MICRKKIARAVTAVAAITQGKNRHGAKRAPGIPMPVLPQEVFRSIVAVCK